MTHWLSRFRDANIENPRVSQARKLALELRRTNYPAPKPETQGTAILFGYQTKAGSSCIFCALIFCEEVVSVPANLGSL